MISEFHEGKKKIPVEGVTDSKHLYEASYSTKSILDTCLRINLAILREAIVLCASHPLVCVRQAHFALCGPVTLWFVQQSHFFLCGPATLRSVHQ